MMKHSHAIHWFSTNIARRKVDKVGLHHTLAISNSVAANFSAMTTNQHTHIRPRPDDATRVVWTVCKFFPYCFFCYCYIDVENGPLFFHCLFFWFYLLFF